jgi:serine/threonine protein phosphatase PrpC
MGGVSLYGDGTSEKNRENEDRYYTCKFEGVQLYMVLDGHHGSRACEFAMKRIPSLLLRYNMGESGEKAAEALKYAFENTEKNFFMMLDPSITRKMGLQLEMQVGIYSQCGEE